MRLAIPTLILAVILVLGWRVCSGGERDHLQLAEQDLPAELREGYEAIAEQAGESGEAATETLASVADRASKAAEKAASDGRDALARTGRAAAREGAAAVDNATRTASRIAEDASRAVQKAPEASQSAPEIQPPSLPAVSATPRATAPKSLREEDRAKGGKLYVVQPGDWLRQIAREQYGDASRSRDIARANSLANPNAIKPGQKLVLP